MRTTRSPRQPSAICDCAETNPLRQSASAKIYNVWSKNLQRYEKMLHLHPLDPAICEARSGIENALSA